MFEGDDAESLTWRQHIPQVEAQALLQREQRWGGKLEITLKWCKMTCKMSERYQSQQFSLHRLPWLKWGNCFKKRDKGSKYSEVISKLEEMPHLLPQTKKWGDFEPKRPTTIQTKRQKTKLQAKTCRQRPYMRRAKKNDTGRTRTYAGKSQSISSRSP